LHRKSFPQAEIKHLLGAQVVRHEEVESGGYGRVNAHWRAELDDGRSIFVKQALTSEAEEWLRTEHLVYESVEGPFMPAYLGGSGGLLVLEDLASAEWAPPWSAERIDAVLTTLSALRTSVPPAGLPRLAELRTALVGWPIVAGDPEPLLSTGVCSAQWLDGALPALLHACEQVLLDGEDLLHADVRSDNLCFRGGVALLFDWNIACVGNGAFDVAFWLPSLRLEGGPEPWQVLPDAGLLAAAVAGFFAARAGLPPPGGAPTVREFQRRQLEAALPWAALELGLSAVA
jgi:hypothetical protein